MEKTKNENLIVHAGCGENRFSFFEFPDSLPDVAFDPEYAERVAGECYGDEIPGGWYDDAVRVVGNFDLWGATCAEFSSSRDEIDYLRRSHDGVVESLKGLASAFVKMEKSIGERRDAVLSEPMPEPAAVSSPGVSSPSPFPRKLWQLDTATGEVSVLSQEYPQGVPREHSLEAAAAANHALEVLESGIAKRSREEGPLSYATPQCFGGFMDIFPSLKTSANMTPADAGQPPPANPASLPPGFVAVPLPDDGEPVLGYKRKPGHYLTRGGYFVDLTYNVGTGIGQYPFPWVHFDKHHRGNCYDVFFTEKGEAYQVTQVGASESKFSLCHYDHLPDFDIVQKCVHPAAEELRDDPQAESKFVVTPDKPLQAVVPVEHYNQTSEQFSRFRGEVGQAFAMLAKAFGVCDCQCDCQCGGEGGESGRAASHAREDLESKLAESRAEVHSLNKRIAELARALGSEKQVSSELDAKCDRLTEQWVGITEIVEKLRNERDKACRERDELATKFGTAMAQRDLAREELAKLQAEREPVTWEALLADGVWEASLSGAENDTVLFQWEYWGKLPHGLDKPPKLGKYLFVNGVGTLIKAAGDYGKAGS